jgi:hypothetical protein
MLQMNPSDIKSQNESMLRSLGIRINSSLPKLEDPANLKPRNAQQVMTRAFVMSWVIGVGHHKPGSEMLERVRSAGLEDHLTPIEREWLGHKSLDFPTKCEIAWHCEAVQACAWALGLVEMHPLKDPDEKLAEYFVPVNDPSTRIEQATLRPFPRIYEQADLYYRLHWAAIDAMLGSVTFPRYEVAVRMRRKALDWIIGVPFEWDEIRSDT